MNTQWIKHSIWILFLLSIFGCKPDETALETSNKLVVRMGYELDGLNPVFSGASTPNLLLKLMPSLINFDPVSLELTPLLIEELPQKIKIDTGICKNQPVYQFKIRDGARWTDGKPILIADYIFSLKVGLNPKILNNKWLKIISMVQDVVVLDKRTCQVVLKKDRQMAAAYFAGFELLAEHHYDPNHLLKDIPLKAFTDFDKLAKGNPNVEQFTKEFSDEKFIRDPKFIFGAGPYQITKWEDHQITLVKKKNYWGESLAKEKPLLAGYPDTIIYKEVTDEIASMSYLKNHELDLLSDLSPSNFIELKKDPNLKNYFDFYTPKSKEYYTIGFNNRSPKLAKEVRNAIARCFDVNELLEVATEGLGQRGVGPISDSSPYFNKNLKPIEKDQALAKQLLKEAGWADKDGNGILEKTINGKQEELKIEFLVANTIPFGKSISPILKKEAAKLGIQINIVSTEWSAVIQKLLNRNFEMAMFRLSTAPGDYQPYTSWHSDNTGKNGKNHLGFSSAACDSIIEALQQHPDTNIAVKKKLYADFQKELYDNQPSIFLFYPVKTIVVSKKWKPMLSTMRPGYFENAFQLKKK